MVLADWPFGAGAGDDVASGADGDCETAPMKRVLRMGAGLLPRALELAISTMRKGEHTKFRIDRTVGAGSSDAESVAVKEALDAGESAASALSVSRTTRPYPIAHWLFSVLWQASPPTGDLVNTLSAG